jgi:hypothetical protein
MTGRVRGASTNLLFPFLAVVIGIFIGIFPLFSTLRAYFRDDMQAQYLPLMVAMGRSIIHGHWPVLTLQMQNGGALLGEHQYGLLNPFSLGSYAVLALIDNLAVGAAFLAILHLTILCLGTYNLARTCGASREDALAAAATFCGSNFLYYWYASSWLPGLISMAWFVWAAAFLWKADGSPKNWLLGVGFVYLTVTSGWPHTDLALAVLCCFRAWACARWGDNRAAVAVMATFATGCLLAAPALAPLLGMGRISTREIGLANNNNSGVNLYDVLAASSPFHFGQFVFWGKPDVILAPIFFAGWYVLPLLPFVNWNQLRRPSTTVIMLAGLALLFLVATQGPELLASLRFPLRFIPVFHLCVLLLFALISTEAGFTARPYACRAMSLAIVAFGYMASIQAQPALWFLPAMGALVVGALVWFAARPQSLPSARLRSLTLVTGSLLLFAVTRISFPVNLNFPDWGVDDQIGKMAPLEEVPRSYAFYLGPIEIFDSAPPGYPPLGAIPLLTGQATMAGYSPIGYVGMAKSLCVETHGAACPSGGKRLLAATAEGPPLVDLLRIDRIVTYKGHSIRSKFLPLVRPADWFSIQDNGLDAATQRQLEANWQMVSEDRMIRTYARRRPVDWAPGSLAWESPGMQAVSLPGTRATKEEVMVSRRNGSGDKIIFSRIAWPGYYAEFAGRPVRVTTRDDFLLAVDLPDGHEAGMLTLRYRPPLFLPSLLVCLFGFLILIAGLLGGRWFMQPKARQMPLATT